MYRTLETEEKKAYLLKAIEFTGDHNLYGAAMLRVIKEWPIVCEQNLTSVGSNRQAWIGHAAACLELGLPEDITTQAWSSLSEEQQDKANTKAEEAILLWEKKHCEK